MVETKEVSLNNWQKKVWFDEHRYVTLRIGRRGGKTTISALKIADFVSKHSNSIVYYVAPTYIQAKNIMWEMLKQYIPSHWIVDKKEAELKLTLANGSRIELKGADTDPDRLRGVRIDYLICDEIAFFRNWETVWNNVLRPTLLDSKGKALFISTPYGYNHFYNLYMKAFKDNKAYDQEYSSYHFTTYDNNVLDPKEIDKAKAESDEDTFAQEYLAEFKRYTGMVLPYFKRELHYIAPIEIQNSWAFYRGIDFGWVHPSACAFITVSPEGKVYVYDEIKQAGLTNPEFANLIKQKSIGRSFTQTWGDSAAASDIREMNNYGLSVIPVSKTSGNKGEDFTKYKVRKMNQKIKGNNFYVFNNCPQTLFEIENWQYKEVTEGNIRREVPAKINDDIMDACFPAETSILTSLGPKKIKDIKAGDFVCSPYGMNEVYWSGKTGIKEIKDYGIFRSTLNHKIITNRGLVSIDTISYDDIIMLWQSAKPFTFKEFLIGVTQSPKIGLIGIIFKGLLTKSLITRRGYCTVKYGNSIMAKFHMLWSSIILMAIHLIIPLLILPLWVGLSIKNLNKLILGQVVKNIWKKYVHLLEFGTKVKLVDNGIEIKQNQVGLAENHILQPACNVITNLKPDITEKLSSVQKSAVPNLDGKVGLMMLKKNVKSVKNHSLEINIIKFGVVPVNVPLKSSLKKETVYNLSTKYGCYFANGLLVANCSYAVVNIPEYYEASYQQPENSIYQKPDWANNLPNYSGQKKSVNSYFRNRN